MKKFVILYTIILILVVLATAFMFTRVSAQTETPIPTPDTTINIEVPHGYFTMDLSYTIGDIALSVLLLFFGGVFLIYAVFKIVTHFLP